MYKRFLAVLFCLTMIFCGTASASAKSAPPPPINKINALYNSTVPAWERAALAGHYTLAYNDPRVRCGTGCTGFVSAGQVESSFLPSFFRLSTRNQRDGIAHEAAHAYGFLYLQRYSAASWAPATNWQASFDAMDRSMVRTYDGEAFATCVVAAEVDRNWRPAQVRKVCPVALAHWVIAQINH